MTTLRAGPTVPIVMVVFSLAGAVFGMSEETIPLVMLFVPLALALGYDAITGIADVAARRSCRCDPPDRGARVPVWRRIHQLIPPVLTGWGPH